MSLVNGTHTSLRETASQQLSDGGVWLLWILVWSELIVFGLLLGGFLIVSLLEPQAFAAARSHLATPLAGLNTIVLLTSGYFAALAARDAHPAGRHDTRRNLALAALFGFVFAAIKFWEYAGEVGVAADAAFGNFFQLYFLITGFHLAHVIFGAVILLLVALRPQRSNVVLITTMWHAIDLVWVLMFPLIYI